MRSSKRERSTKDTELEEVEPVGEQAPPQKKTRGQVNATPKTTSSPAKGRTRGNSRKASGSAAKEEAASGLKTRKVKEGGATSSEPEQEPGIESKTTRSRKREAKAPAPSIKVAIEKKKSRGRSKKGVADAATDNDAASAMEELKVLFTGIEETGPEGRQVAKLGATILESSVCGLLQLFISFCAQKDLNFFADPCARCISFVYGQSTTHYKAAHWHCLWERYSWQSLAKKIKQSMLIGTWTKQGV